MRPLTAGCLVCAMLACQNVNAAQRRHHIVRHLTQHSTDTIHYTQPSDQLLNLIKSYEGFRSIGYRDSGGVPTVGWGFTGRGVYVGQTMTLQQADLLLALKVGKVQAYVRSMVKVDLNQNQLDALTSFCYNIGDGEFARSQVLHLLNQGQYASVPSHLNRYRYDNGRLLRGLAKRRRAEISLWNKSI